MGTCRSAPDASPSEGGTSNGGASRHCGTSPNIDFDHRRLRTISPGRLEEEKRCYLDGWKACAGAHGRLTPERHGWDAAFSRSALFRLGPFWTQPNGWVGFVTMVQAFSLGWDGARPLALPRRKWYNSSGGVDVPAFFDGFHHVDILDGHGIDGEGIPVEDDQVSEFSDLQ